MKWLIVEYIDKDTKKPTGTVFMWNVAHIEYARFCNENSNLVISLPSGVVKRFDITADEWQEVGQFMSSPAGHKHIITVEV